MADYEVLTDGGFCTTCRKWAHDHPQLRCPWCNAVQVVRVYGELELDRDAAPEVVMAAAERALTYHRRTMAELLELRRQSAIRALVAYGPLEAATRCHHRIETLERIAAPRPGRRERRRKAEPRPPPSKDPARRKAAWREYEARLRKREALLAALPDGERAKLASRLREPLRPPGAGSRPGEGNAS